MLNVYCLTNKIIYEYFKSSIKGSYVEWLAKGLETRTSLIHKMYQENKYNASFWVFPTTKKHSLGGVATWEAYFKGEKYPFEVNEDVLAQVNNLPSRIKTKKPEVRWLN